MNYFKILLFLQHGDKSIFDIPVSKQQAYLNSLGAPKDDIDRGYKQYLCQNFFVPGWKVWLFNILAAFMFPLILLYYLVKGRFLVRGEHVDCIIERKGMDEVVPTEVWQKYNPDNSHWQEGSSLCFSDLTFILKIIKRATRHPYFVLKATMNVVMYSDMIRRHSPMVMIQFGEFSFSSSILTAYCHRNDIKHIDIMHGEKLFFIGDAFFHYDECYVWDEHYIKLFRELKAEPTQFIVALPESLHINITKHINKDAYADYKYYLAVASESEIKGVVDSMQFAKRNGKKVKFRPHPRYTDINLLRKYVNEDEIEDYKKIGILESISNLEYAVGSYTTVLSQAYFSGKNVVLDDVTFQSEHDMLKSLKYILSSKETIRLSDFK